MRRAYDPCYAVYYWAEIILVTRIGSATMNADAHPQPTHVLPGVILERALDLESGRCGIERSFKGRAHRVADRLEYHSTMAGHDVRQKRVMPSDDRIHGCAVLIPAPSTALDVGEQECDRATR